MTGAQHDPSAAALVLASHHLSQSRPDRALQALERSDPTSPGYWRLLATALHNTERYAEAAGAAREGLKQDPDTVGLMYVLASALTELNELAAAERIALHAVRLEPESVMVMSLYGRMLATGGQLEKAAAVLAEARRLDPDDRAVLRTQAFVLWIQTRDRQAVAIIRELLAHDPQDPAALLLLSAIEGEEGAHHTSYDRVRRVLSRDPTLILSLGEHLHEQAAAAHPMMAPARRFLTPHGPAVLWLLVIGALLLSIALRQVWAGLVVAGLYLIYAVYGHVVYRWLRWRFKRRTG